MRRLKNLAGRGVLLPFFAAVALYSFTQFSRGVRPGAVVSGFDVSRAIRHIQSIAAEPRPVGSPGHRRALAYIQSQLQEMGVEVSMQQETGVAERFGRLVMSPVRNVLARIPGRERGNAVMLVAHYDTVAHSLGAADDGFGVGVLLETARVLSADQTRERDVFLLFTDAEEPGMLGAQVFLESHPWRAQVKTILNLEARGTRGRVFMFETGPANRELLSKLRSTGAPAADSLMSTIYRLLPNKTDFTVLAGLQGVSGLNFALADGLENYHTPRDSLANLSRESVREGGELLVSLTSILSRGPAPGAHSESVAYFNWLGGTLVSIPIPLVKALALSYSVCVSCLALLALVRKRLRPADLLLATFACIAALFVLPVLTTAGRGILPHGQGDSPQGAADVLVLIGALMVSIAALSVIFRVLARRASLSACEAGVQLIFALSGSALAVFAPEAAHALVLPGLASFLLLFAPARILAAFSLLIIADFQARLGLYTWISAPTVPAAAVLAFILTILLLSRESLPRLVSLPTRASWMLAVTGALLVLAAMGWSTLSGQSSGLTETVYALDMDRGVASWISSDEKLSEWHRQLAKDRWSAGDAASFFPARDFPHWIAPAPRSEIPAPAIALSSAPGMGVERDLRVEIRPARPGARLQIWSLGQLKVREFRLNGRRLDVRGGRLRLQVLDAQVSPMVLELSGAVPSADSALRVVEAHAGFENLVGLAPPALPGNLLPHGQSHLVFAGRTLMLKEMKGGGAE